MSEATAERVPIEAGFFTIPDDPEESPQLLGTKCRACGEYFFPRRSICAKCLEPDTEDVLLSPDGTLYTWTYVHFPMFGIKADDVRGYGVGQIDLPEGPRVQAVLSGGEHEFRIGMPMHLELESLKQNKEGQDVVIFRFRPSENAR
jgi:uncharacterized OB-fold protein